MASPKPISGALWDNESGDARSHSVLTYRRPAVDAPSPPSAESELPPVILRIPDLEALEVDPEEEEEKAETSRSWANVAWWAFVVSGTVVATVLIAGGKKTAAPPEAAPKWDAAPSTPTALPAFKAPTAEAAATAQRPTYSAPAYSAPVYSMPDKAHASPSDQPAPAPSAWPPVERQLPANRAAPAPAYEQPAVQPPAYEAPSGQPGYEAPAAQPAAEEAGPSFPDTARRAPANDPFSLPDDRRDAWTQRQPRQNGAASRAPVNTADTRNSAAEAARRAQPPVARFNNTIGKPDIDTNHDSPRQSLY